MRAMGERQKGKWKMEKEKGTNQSLPGYYAGYGLAGLHDFHLSIEH